MNLNIKINDKVNNKVYYNIRGKAYDEIYRGIKNDKFIKL